MDRLVPLFEDMKDFVRATVKASETVLQGEMQEIRTELKGEIRELRSNLKNLECKVDGLERKIDGLERKVDVIQCAITAHTKHLKTVETTVDDHEVRLTRVEQRTF